MDIVEITEEQRDRILAFEENHFGDLKSKAIKPAKLTQSVSSFANTSGGEIYLGIDEIDKRRKVRQWRGFADIEEANAHVQEVTRLSPLGGHYLGTFLTCPGETGYVLLLQIYKTKDIIEASNSIPYIRKGAQNLPVEGDESVARLRLDKGINSFDVYSGENCHSLRFKPAT